MHKKPWILLSLILIALPTLHGCATWSHWANEEELRNFDSSNGHYFPDFLSAVFKSAKRFESDFPTKDLAADGIKLIEIKYLNDKSQNQNEANLSWSADGVYLSYEVQGIKKRHIRLKNLGGQYSRELAVIPESKDRFFNTNFSRDMHSFNAGLSWSKDSTRFAFMSNSGNGNYNIYLGAIGVKEEPIAASPTKEGFAIWSTRSDEIAFVSGRTGNGDLYLLDVDTKHLQRLTTSNHLDIFPDWSPKGQHIAYSTGADNNHSIMILKRRPSGRWSNPIQLTDWPHDDLRPKISPDGNHVAFYSNSGYDHGQKQWNIHVLPLTQLKTHRPISLTKSVIARNVVLDLNTGPSWSPDGRSIFFVKKDSARMNPICAYDLYSGKKYVLATNTKMNRDIMISKLGVLSFRAQVGVWDRVFIALTNQGLQLKPVRKRLSRIIYLPEMKEEISL